MNNNGNNGLVVIEHRVLAPYISMRIITNHTAAWPVVAATDAATDKAFVCIHTDHVEVRYTFL